MPDFDDGNCDDLRVEDYSSDEDESKNKVLEIRQNNVINYKTNFHVQQELRRSLNRHEVFKLNGPHNTPNKRPSRDERLTICPNSRRQSNNPRTSIK